MTKSTQKIVAGLMGFAMVLSLAVVAAGTTSAQTVTAQYSFARDLTVGSTGADVTALQSILYAKGYLSVAPTGYFGALTKSALGAWQAAAGISPAAGYFGPITRAAISTSGSVPVSPVTCPVGYTCTSTGGSTGGSTSGSLGAGEASLEDLNVRDGNDDDVTEGEEAEIAEIEFDVEDGDVEINRVDLTFTTGATGTEEDEPWETFETVSLWADGKELASEDVSDEDEWLEDDSPFVFRFTGLDYVVEEGDMANITVMVEAQGNVDGAEDTIPWTVYVDTDGIRGTDGEGIEQYIGQSSETATFDVVEEGEGEELTVRRSSEDPDSTTFQVEEDERSDWYTVFAFEIESEDADIELNDFPITFTTSDNNVDDVINDVRLVIDGEEFDDFDWVSPTGTTASTTFDIDGDYVVESDDTVTVEVMVEFKAQGSAYADSTTIQASVVGSQIEAEGSDDIDVDGSATGDIHTLEETGVDVTRTSRSADTTVVDGADNDYATFRVEVDVSAFEQDVYISKNAATAFTYRIEDSNGNTIATSTGTTSAAVSSEADEESSFYVVDEGGSESFEFEVTFNPAPAEEGKTLRLQLLTVSYRDSTSGSVQTWTANPENEYESSTAYIND